MGLFTRKDSASESSPSRPRPSVSSEAQAAELRGRARRRLAGAIALVLAAVVLLPIAGDEHHGQARMAPPQRRALQVQPGQRTGGEVADEGVGLVQQRVERLAAVRQVQHLAALACVEAARIETAVLIAGQGAHAVAARRLQLQDIGAEIGQVLGGGRPGDELGQFDDALAGQRTGGVGLRHESPAWPCAPCAAGCRCRPLRRGTAPAGGRAGAATGVRPGRRRCRSPVRRAVSRR